MKKGLRLVSCLFLVLFLVLQCIPAVCEQVSTRWADASDEIDKYLDTAFEDYLAGNADAAYRNVNDAYFRVYETTGFERQTMSYVSGVRKNAVEMQFSACKAAVKKENTNQETIVSVRAALLKLKAMIREVQAKYSNAKVFATTLREVLSANRNLWGAIMLADNQWFVEEPREIDILDRIGGGDGFTGGLLYGIIQNWEPAKWVQFGWATGALAASSLNDYAEPADEKQVWAIYAGNARVQR